MTDAVLFEIEPASGVATLTLNRPAQFNAFDRPMVNRWADLLIEISRNRDVRALVVTGAGKAFCAGGDIAELRAFLDMSMAERKAFLWENVYRVPRALATVDIPVIAAINGTARGAGLDMALMCDIRIMERSVVVGESYISMGLMPGDGGGWLLPRLVGMARALEMLWTGDGVDAEKAERIGLVSHVVDDGAALDAALALARRIAAQPTDAIRMTKRSAMQGASIPFETHLDQASSHMAVLEDSAEFRERLEAFVARRK